MDTPSIRSSGNKGRSALRAIPIEQALLDTAKQFLESYQFDLRIRQHLHEDKMENSVGKHKYYVLANEQKYEPGYILIMKGHPIVFLQGRLQYGFVLRLRVHPSVYQHQAIFVGTLDTINTSLRLEDVLFYEGKQLQQDPYSTRFSILQTFFNQAFIQDFRLSGLTVSMAELHPLSKVKELVTSGHYHTIEFIPEQGGRRRFFLSTQPSSQVIGKQATKVPVQIPKEQRKVALAFKIKGMPDTYELKDETGTVLGKAAVQTASLSQLLRQSIQAEGKKVNVEWSEEFERFKITGLSEA